MTTQIANRTLNLDACGCGSWGCEDCYPDDEPQLKPAPPPVVNAWNKPLIPSLPIDLASNDSQSVEDNHWTEERTTKFVTEWQTKKKKKPVARLTQIQKDKQLTCRDCKNTFVYSAYHQKRNQKLGWKEPKTCRGCVDKRHAKA